MKLLSLFCALSCFSIYASEQLDESANIQQNTIVLNNDELQEIRQPDEKYDNLINLFCLCEAISIDSKKVTNAKFNATETILFKTHEDLKDMLKTIEKVSCNVDNIAINKDVYFSAYYYAFKFIFSNKLRNEFNAIYKKQILHNDIIDCIKLSNEVILQLRYQIYNSMLYVINNEISLSLANKDPINFAKQIFYMLNDEENNEQKKIKISDIYTSYNNKYGEELNIIDNFANIFFIFKSIVLSTKSMLDVISNNLYYWYYESDIKSKCKKIINICRGIISIKDIENKYSDLLNAFYVKLYNETNAILATIDRVKKSLSNIPGYADVALEIFAEYIKLLKNIADEKFNNKCNQQDLNNLNNTLNEKLNEINKNYHPHNIVTHKKFVEDMTNCNKIICEIIKTYVMQGQSIQISLTDNSNAVLQRFADSMIDNKATVTTRILKYFVEKANTALKNTNDWKLHFPYNQCKNEEQIESKTVLNDQNSLETIQSEDDKAEFNDNDAQHNMLEANDMQNNKDIQLDVTEDTAEMKMNDDESNLSEPCKED